jgi:hypothetical protein
MNRKIIAAASIIAIVVIVISVISDSALDESTISQIIFVDAVYEPKNKIVRITYNDNSEMTNLITLEVLGMEKTFHKEFSQSSFVETIEINSEPKYGWSTTPVVFSINHDEFGKIGLKTEIYEQGESKPRIIYSKI